MEQNPYIFNLSQTVEYSKDGDFHKSASLEFTAPSMDDFDLAIELSQLVMRATLDARDIIPTDEKEVAEEADVTAESIKMILLASKNVKFSEIADVFKRLVPHVCVVDGTHPLSAGVIRKLSISDFTEMLCGYIANFTFPSLFSGEGE